MSNINTEALRHIPYYAESIALTPWHKGYYIDQDGLAWRSVTKPGFDRIEGYVDLSNAKCHWPDGVNTAGAPMYAYYTKAVFDAGVFSNGRDGKWYGFVGAFTPTGYAWIESDRHIETDIVYLVVDTIKRDGRAELHYRVYEVFNHGQANERKVLLSWTESVEGLTLQKRDMYDGITQMATIAFHVNNEMEIPPLDRNGIKLSGMRFFDTVAYDIDGRQHRWDTNILESIHWGRSEHSVHRYENTKEDWSDVNIDLTFYNIQQA